MTCMFLIVVLTTFSAADDVPAWEPIGDVAAVTLLEGNTVVLDVEEPATAGAVSSPIRLPSGSDAVMVSVEIAGADARGVTLAVHDAESGDPLGYWQNPVALDQPTIESAVMELTRSVKNVRVFIGTDGRASNATVKHLDTVALRQTGAYETMQYAGAVSPGKTVGQSFTARGKRFAGLTLRTRYTQPNQAPPDLIARLYAWDADPATTRANGAIAELRVPGALIPAGSRSIERDLMLPLDAPVQPGHLYYVEVSSADPDAAQSSDSAMPVCLIFAGPGGIPDAETFINDRANGWDLTTRIYHRN